MIKTLRQEPEKSERTSTAENWSIQHTRKEIYTRYDMSIAFGVLRAREQEEMRNRSAGIGAA